MPASLCPFYYPTTAVFVDDDADFLVNLSLQLDQGLAYQLSASPRDALRDINVAGTQKPLYKRCLSPYRDYPDKQPFGNSRQVFVLDLGMISEEVHNAQRFSEVSVAVVDYDMPEMNGLEFCHSIENPYVKKILLTGKADEKTAVDAFNQGIIDQFIMKSDAAAAGKLNAIIAKLQHVYFEDIAATFIKCLAVNSPDFLGDPRFGEFFAELRHKKGIIEYYLSLEPSGFLLLTASGAAYLLIVMSPDDFKVHWEIARDQDGPRELLDILERQEKLPYFWRTGGFFNSGGDDWMDQLVPAETFVGQTVYRFALIGDPPSISTGRESVLSYEDYLSLIDDMALGEGLHKQPN